MVTRINELRNKMMNVTVAGVVRRKSDLLPFKNKDGKYFSFYLFNHDGSNIRVTAYKDAADKFFATLHVGKSYEISKISVKENKYQEKIELQLTLTTNCIVKEIQYDIIVPASYTVIAEIKESTQPIDVIGRAVSVYSTKRILKSGESKSVSILTIMDHTAYIDVTFWAHADRIHEIPDDELSTAVIAIEGATVSFYSGAYTLNVGQRAEVQINPENKLAETLKTLSQDTTSFNLSQRSESTCSQDTSRSYPTAQLIATIKRKLEKLTAKEEKIKMKKFMFQDLLRQYEKE